MKINRKKNRRVLFIIALSTIFLLYSLFLTISSQNFQASTENDKNYNLFNIENTLKSQDLTFNDDSFTYSGLGAPWNITHYLNTTKNGIEVSFVNNSYNDQSASVSLINGGEGYKLISKIYNLYDTRNWNNGTFHYGADDGTDLDDGDYNDTGSIVNQFQNWTFKDDDQGSNNDMSGNYFNDGSRDYLELRMNGRGSPNSYSYDQNDICWWETTFDVPRGKVINSYLTFQMNPIHLMNFPSWELAFWIDDEKIYSYDSLSLKEFNPWHKFTVPLTIWYNQSVFNDPVNSSDINFKMSWEYVPQSATYNGFTNGNYQQIYIDNVELWIKAEADPEEINLLLNSSEVESDGWGKGHIQYNALNGRWTGDYVYANFSSSDPVTLSNYTMELETDLQLYLIKNFPESNWKEDTSELGTNFELKNGENVNWLTYANIQFPDSYEETNLTLIFPEDVNITEVYTPTDTTRTNNILDNCDNSTPGLLNIPVRDVTSVYNGFFQIKGVSPNYCEDLKFYNNHTGGWVENSTVLSEDYLNVTAEITNNALVSSYLDQTQAILTIQFPNGTIWKSQHKDVKNNGYVYFDPIYIPSTPPEYEFGEYDVAVTWNNSFNSFDLNETGVIYNTFTVIHNAVLKPEDGNYDGYYNGAYYIEDVPDGIIKNIYIEFYDEVDSSAITEDFAEVYTKYSGIEYLPMVGAGGIYLLQYNTSQAGAGNTTITVYGNSSYHINTEFDITIEVEKETILTLEQDFFENVPYKQNFTLRFNYTEKYNESNGIDITSFSTTWEDGYYFLNELSQGSYELICNTSAYQANIIRNFTISVDADNYEKKIEVIRVMISELSSSITLYLNGNVTNANDKITIGLYSQINITVQYQDEYNNHISNATVYVTGGGFGRLDLDENETEERYTLILNATEIGQTIDSLSVYAKADNYNLQIIPFLIEITEEDSYWQLYLNNIDKSSDPALEFPIGTMLNISVNYTDQNGAHIENSNITLIGEGLSEDIPYNSSIDLNVLLMNTTEQLTIGVNLFTIIAEGTNYQTQAIDLRLILRRINVDITPISHNKTISITPRSSFTVSVALNNTDFGGFVKNATVTYSWAFGVGFLNDTNNDGIYNHTFGGIPQGTYQMRISGYAGDNYDIMTYEITISAITPEANILATYFTLYSNYLKAQQESESFRRSLIISIIAGVVAGAGLGGYLVLYRLYLRYPPAIRKLRKYRKSLKRKRAPDISTSSRKEIFRDTFKESFGKGYQPMGFKETK
jgi:hypothetical protein